MVKIIVNKVEEKTEKDYSNPRLKNPGTLHKYNYVSSGSIEVALEEANDIRSGYLDSSIIDRINDELGIYGEVQIQVKKTGAKYGGWETIWRGEI